MDQNCYFSIKTPLSQEAYSIKESLLNGKYKQFSVLCQGKLLYSIHPTALEDGFEETLHFFEMNSHRVSLPNDLNQAQLDSVVKYFYFKEIKPVSHIFDVFQMFEIAVFLKISTLMKEIMEFLLGKINETTENMHVLKEQTEPFQILKFSIEFAIKSEFNFVKTLIAQSVGFMVKNEREEEILKVFNDELLERLQKSLSEPVFIFFMQVFTEKKASNELKMEFLSRFVKKLRRNLKGEKLRKFLMEITEKHLDRSKIANQKIEEFLEKLLVDENSSMFEDLLEKEDKFNEERGQNEVKIVKESIQNEQNKGKIEEDELKKEILFKENRNKMRKKEEFGLKKEISRVSRQNKIFVGLFVLMFCLLIRMESKIRSLERKISSLSNQEENEKSPSPFTFALEEAKSNIFSLSNFNKTAEKINSDGLFAEIQANFLKNPTFSLKIEKNKDSNIFIGFCSHPSGFKKQSSFLFFLKRGYFYTMSEGRVYAPSFNSSSAFINKKVISVENSYDANKRGMVMTFYLEGRVIVSFLVDDLGLEDQKLLRPCVALADEGDRVTFVENPRFEKEN